MSEVFLALLIVGVLFVADPERLQMVIDKVRDFANWLAE
jgi:hypothetical protein